MSKTNEIGEVKFKRGLGYKSEGVDNFVDHAEEKIGIIATEKEKLEQETIRLKEDIGKLVEVVKNREERFEELKKMYLELKEAAPCKIYDGPDASEVIDVSNKIAEKIIEDAEKSASKIYEDALIKQEDVTVFIDSANKLATIIITDAKEKADTITKNAKKSIINTKALFEELIESSSMVKKILVELNLGAEQIEQVVTQQAVDIDRQVEDFIDLSDIIDFSEIVDSYSG